MVLRDSVQKHFRQWLDRRQPLAIAETLTQKNIYILPAAQSMGFLLIILLLWLVGTNYENNLVLAVSYLLMAIFVSSIFATHRNLSGISVSVEGCGQAFAGQPIAVHLKVNNPSKSARFRLKFSWSNATVVVADIQPMTDLSLDISLPTEHRGWLRPGRLKIESCYPLGLFRAWTLPKLSAPVLVFPQPTDADALDGAESEGMEGQVHRRGTDDFGGLEKWRPGIPMQRIAWKQYSSGKGLLEKQFEAQTANAEWLEWSAYPNLDVEGKLSALCGKALEMERLNQHYGLRIPNVLIAPSQGEAHLVEVLTSLASHQSGDSAASTRGRAE